MKIQSTATQKCNIIAKIILSSEIILRRKCKKREKNEIHFLQTPAPLVKVKGPVEAKDCPLNQKKKEICSA